MRRVHRCNVQLKATRGRLPTKPATLILQTVHERAATAAAPTTTDAFRPRDATAPALRPTPSTAPVLNFSSVLYRFRYPLRLHSIHAERFAVRLSRDRTLAFERNPSCGSIALILPFQIVAVILQFLSTILSSFYYDSTRFTIL